MENLTKDSLPFDRWYSVREVEGLLSDATIHLQSLLALAAPHILDNIPYTFHTEDTFYYLMDMLNLVQTAKSQLELTQSVDYVSNATQTQEGDVAVVDGNDFERKDISAYCRCQDDKETQTVKTQQKDCCLQTTVSTVMKHACCQTTDIVMQNSCCQTVNTSFKDVCFQTERNEEDGYSQTERGEYVDKMTFMSIEDIKTLEEANNELESANEIAQRSNDRHKPSHKTRRAPEPPLAEVIKRRMRLMTQQRSKSSITTSAPTHRPVVVSEAGPSTNYDENQVNAGSSIKQCHQSTITINYPVDLNPFGEDSNSRNEDNGDKSD